MYVPESAQVGKAVGKIKANDEDLGINAEMTYKITNEEGAAMFSISTDSDKKEGVISLKKVWTRFYPSSYKLRIMIAPDLGSPAKYSIFMSVLPAMLYLFPGWPNVISVSPLIFFLMFCSLWTTRRRRLIL